MDTGQCKGARAAGVIDPGACRRSARDAASVSHYGGFSATSLGGRALSRAFPATAWCGPAIRELLGAEPEFALNLLTQSTRYVHVLGLAHLDEARLPDDRRTRARFLMEAGYRRILARLPNRPAGLLGVLGKLGSRVLSRSDYEALLRVIRLDAPRKALVHARAIAPMRIRLLDALPPCYAGARVLRCVRTAGHADLVVSMVIAAETHLGADSRQRLAASFGAVDDIGKLWPWLDHVLRDAEFPAAPWEGTARIRPVRTVGELSRTARSFENCAKNYVSEAMIGTHCFYLWQTGSGRVLVLLQRDPFLGWLIDDLRGPRNRTVSSGLARRIRDEFNASGVVNGDLDHDTALFSRFV